MVINMAGPLPMGLRAITCIYFGVFLSGHKEGMVELLHSVFFKQVPKIDISVALSKNSHGYLETIKLMLSSFYS